MKGMIFPKVHKHWVIKLFSNGEPCARLVHRGTRNTSGLDLATMIAFTFLHGPMEGAKTPTPRKRLGETWGDTSSYTGDGGHSAWRRCPPRSEDRL